jgi:hypothetical protein
MAVPTLYRSTDASAPSLTGEVGSLITLLDAILVDGYGAKAAAGWTKSYTGTNKAAYRQASGNQRYLRVDDDITANAKFARTVGYETMTDVDTGVSAFPTEGQEAGGLYTFKTASNGATVRPWVAYATGQSIMLYSLAAENSLVGTAEYVGGIYFGDFTSNVTADDYNTAIITGFNSTYSSSGWADTCSTYSVTLDSGCYICRDYGGTASVGFDKRSPSSTYQTRFGSGGVAYPDPISGGLNISPVELHEAGNINRGTLPGIWQINHDDSNFNMLDTFSGDAGGSLAGKEFIISYAWSGCCLAVETNGGWL